MDRRPIGVFDSGLGGLTMVKALRELLPAEDIIYLGDTGRVPYGPRSRETILKYAGQDAEFLAGMDIKAMVIACNTVCSIAYEKLKNAYEIPVYEVVKTPAAAALAATKNGRIGVIGTEATIRSRAYEKALYDLSGSADVYSMPCPLFVPLVEEGWTQPGNEAVEYIARHYLTALRESKIDTLILGCTHYSLLSDAIMKIMGTDTVLIDSGAETAKLVSSDLSKRKLLRDDDKEPVMRYYVTDSAEGFSKQASRFLKSDIQGQVRQITLI